MASILPNAIINKDIFPCKMCGIWFRSERNLQAHLMYYCSGRPRDTELASEKQTNTHQLSRSCTYPQCNMSFLGPQALKMHLSTHSAFKTEETSPGNSLKCTICDYTADTLMVLQPHILTHLSQTGFRCTQCHFSFQTPRDLSKHQELHRHGGLESKSTKEDQTELSESVGVASPEDDKSVMESPDHQNTEQEKSEQVQGASKAEVGSGIKAEPSLSYGRVKSEPSSPRLASSPIQNHMTPAFPVPPFLPHVPFSHDIPAVPQASEILAKMSELVHRRLRHGGTNYPPVMYSTLVPKGATCFECNITFSNLDNYLVHKKHYCNGRWQHLSKSPDYGILDKAAVSPKPGGGLASMLNAGQQFEVKGHNPAQFNASQVEPFSTGGKAPEEFPVNGKKASTPCDAEESPNGITLDSKSPKTSESEVDHNRTTCEACKITFSRQENYMVHKQYYCATRHDPPAKRAANKHVQKSFRTRKRRKMPSPDAVVSQSYPISGSYMSQDTVDSLKDALHHRYNMIQGLVPKHPEPSLTVTKSALGSKCNAAAQEEGDAPIDLSKKCTVQFGNVSGLMDYHECAMCKISFNKVEDYLSHKQNFCPGAVSEKKEEGSRNQNASDSVGIERSVQSVSASAEEHPSVKDDHDVMNSDTYPLGGAKKIRADEQIWPYYEIKPADYATGIFVPQNERRQSPNEGTEGKKEQPMPDGSHVGSENMENPKLINSSLRGDDKQGNESSRSSAPSVLFTACTPDQDGAIKPKESMASSPAPKMEEISSLKRSTNGSIPSAVNGKYCRPCDIQFNNLSNFITHKKFYCSAHTTEHVK